MPMGTLRDRTNSLASFPFRLKAWFITQKIDGTFNLTPLQIPIWDNPEFLLGMVNGGYITWASQRIKKMCDLFEGASLLSFEQVRSKFNLDKHQIFRYLQIQDFITKTNFQF